MIRSLRTREGRLFAMVGILGELRAGRAPDSLYSRVVGLLRAMTIEEIAALESLLVERRDSVRPTPIH